MKQIAQQLAEGGTLIGKTMWDMDDPADKTTITAARYELISGTPILFLDGEDWNCSFNCRLIGYGDERSEDLLIWVPGVRVVVENVKREE